MNDTKYGATTCVLSQDRIRVKKILYQLDCGIFYINACSRISPYLPLTKRQHVGAGSTLSQACVRSFFQPKLCRIVIT